MKKTINRIAFGLNRVYLSVIIVLFLFFVSASVIQCHAFSMSNGNYSLQGSVNTATDQDLQNSSNAYKQSIQPQGGTAGGSNSVIESGLNYPNNNSSLTFTIAPTLIDFGALTATNPVTRTTSLAINNSGLSFQVFAYENYELKSAGNAIIPDTSCDNGSCNDKSGSPWSSNYTYGFGYRCDNVIGKDCAAGFSQNNFKPFADLANKQDQAVVMNSASSPQNAQAQLTYQLTVSGTQQTGSYSNTVSYILVPSY